MCERQFGIVCVAQRRARGVQHLLQRRPGHIHTNTHVHVLANAARCVRPVGWERRKHTRCAPCQTHNTERVPALGKYVKRLHHDHSANHCVGRRNRRDNVAGDLFRLEARLLWNVVYVRTEIRRSSDEPKRVVVVFVKRLRRLRRTCGQTTTALHKQRRILAERQDAAIAQANLRRLRHV